MKKNTAYTVFALAIVAVIVFAYMLITVQDFTRHSLLSAEGVSISAESMDDMQIDLEIVNQNDTRWAMEIMCDDLTMRFMDYGSQIACTASVLRHYEVYHAPLELYNLFCENGIYDFEQSSFAARFRFSNVKYEYLPSKYNKVYQSPKMYHPSVFDEDTILSLLQEGTPVMVRVAGMPIERYWVVIIGVKDHEFIIMDPLKTEYSTLSLYDNHIYEVIYFET